MSKIEELQLELSVKCNSNCSMCPRDKLKRGGKPGFMSFDLAKKIIDGAYEEGARLLKPQWFGESLLSPDFEKIIKYAKDKGMKIMLITNGSLMDEKKRKFIVKNNIDKVFFSIDSCKKEEYEKIRKGLKFDKVVGNLEALYRERKKTKVFVTAVDTGKNTEGMEEFFKDKCDKVYINKPVLYNALIKDLKPIKCKHKVMERLVVGWEGTAYLCCHDWLGEYPFPNLQSRDVCNVWNDCKRRRWLRNLKILEICQRCMLSLEQ